MLEDALRIIDRIVSVYREKGNPKQRLGAFIDSIGFDEFKRLVIVNE